MPGKKTDNKVKIAPAPVTPANVLVDIAMIVDVIPREKHDDLAAILEKALFKEHGRHYITKAESGIRACLTASQLKKFDEVVKFLAKYTVEK